MSVLIDNEIKHSEIEKVIRTRIDNSNLKGQLTPFHIYILNSLRLADRQMASELALKVGRAATSFTPILDQLQNAGFICREQHPKDRRSVLICLTEKGYSSLKTVKAIVDDVETEFGGK